MSADTGRDIPRSELSGRRFAVTYHLTLPEAQARALAEDLCYEQTVEVHRDVVPPGPIRDHLVGRIEHFDAGPSGAFAATLSFAVETAGTELTQWLNVVFGNASLIPAASASLGSSRRRAASPGCRGRDSGARGCGRSRARGTGRSSARP